MKEYLTTNRVSDNVPGKTGRFRNPNSEGIMKGFLRKRDKKKEFEIELIFKIKI